MKKRARMVAVMAKYNPFAEKAGMRKIAEQLPAKQVLRISEVLSGLGFNLQLLGSQKYVMSNLESLSSQQARDLETSFHRK
jgi:uncharacterized protein YbaP (TraB family)